MFILKQVSIDKIHAFIESDLLNRNIMSNTKNADMYPHRYWVCEWNICSLLVKRKSCKYIFPLLVQALDKYFCIILLNTNM